MHVYRNGTARISKSFLHYSKVTGRTTATPSAFTTGSLRFHLLNAPKSRACRVSSTLLNCPGANWSKDGERSYAIEAANIYRQTLSTWTCSPRQ